LILTRKFSRSAWGKQANKTPNKKKLTSSSLFAIPKKIIDAIAQQNRKFIISFFHIR
jgi:hypothetical protein